MLIGKKDKRSHFALRNEYFAKQESLRKKRKQGHFKEIPIKENK